MSVPPSCDEITIQDGVPLECSGEHQMTSGPDGDMNVIIHRTQVLEPEPHWAHWIVEDDTVTERFTPDQ